MTYNQVQSFQINDYANHYVDIEITGYSSAECCTAKVLQAGVARLICWLGTTDQCLTVILEYIDFGRVQPTFDWAYSCS